MHKYLLSVQMLLERDGSTEQTCMGVIESTDYVYHSSERFF